MGIRRHKKKNEKNGAQYRIPIIISSFMNRMVKNYVKCINGLKCNLLFAYSFRYSCTAVCLFVCFIFCAPRIFFTFRFVLLCTAPLSSAQFISVQFSSVLFTRLVASHHTRFFSLSQHNTTQHSLEIDNH